MTPRIRIGLVSATVRSLPPLQSAFSRLWPEADILSVIDESLETDRARAEGPGLAFGRRLETLARYAVDNGAAAVQFTCSSFPVEIGALKARLPVPVFRPDEAVYLAAAETCGPVRVLVTFPPALTAAARMIEELQTSVAGVGDFVVSLVPGALEASEAGRLEQHDRVI